MSSPVFIEFSTLFGELFSLGSNLYCFSKCGFVIFLKPKDVPVGTCEIAQKTGHYRIIFLTHRHPETPVVTKMACVAPSHANVTQWTKSLDTHVPARRATSRRVRWIHPAWTSTSVRVVTPTRVTMEVSAKTSYPHLWLSQSLEKNYGSSSFSKYIYIYSFIYIHYIHIYIYIYIFIQYIHST